MNFEHREVLVFFTKFDSYSVLEVTHTLFKKSQTPINNI